MYILRLWVRVHPVSVDAAKTRKADVRETWSRFKFRLHKTSFLALVSTSFWYWPSVKRSFFFSKKAPPRQNQCTRLKTDDRDGTFTCTSRADEHQVIRMAFAKINTMHAVHCTTFLNPGTFCDRRTHILFTCGHVSNRRIFILCSTKKPTPNHSKLRRTHPVLRRPVTLKIRRVNVKEFYLLSVGPSESLKPETKLFACGL